MAASSSRTRRPPKGEGFVLTERDEAVLGSVWELRCVTRDQVQRLHFGGRAGTPGALSLSICLRRLRLLHTHGYLLARRMPVGRAGGSSPFVYSLGPRADQLLAERLGLETDVVRDRRRRDAALAWMFYEHRQAVTDVRIAFILACRTRGFGLQWRSDEELALMDEQVMLNGRRVAIRPDGFFVVELTSGARAAFFLEVQRVSEPVKYRRKAAGYLEYWASGAYTARFGFKSLRVLAVTDSRRRAEHLRDAAEQVGGRSLFWSAALDEVTAEPFGARWFVGGTTEEQTLLGGTTSGVRGVGSMPGDGGESAGHSFGSGRGEQPQEQGRATHIDARWM